MRQVDEKLSHFDFRINFEHEGKTNSLEKCIVAKHEQLKRFEIEVDRKFESFEMKCVRNKDLYIEKLENQLSERMEQK